MSWMVHALFDTVPSTTGAVSRYTSNSVAESSRSVRSLQEDEEEEHHHSNPNQPEALIEGMVIDLQRLSQHFRRFEDEVDEEESFGGQTILSSAPSAPTFAEEAPTVAILATSPLFASRQRNSNNNPLSISTVESVEMDRNRMDDNDSLAASTCSFASAPLSFQPSLLDSAITFSSDQSSSSSWRQESFRSATSSHREGSSWRTVANTVTTTSGRNNNAANSSPITMVVPRGRSTRDNLVWYADFSDEDWRSFRNSAKMILQALGITSPLNPTTGTSSNLRPLVLPPLPPEQPLVLSGHSSEPSVVAYDVLPSCFICTFCQDAIVGALTLDCDCRKNVCTACWEYHCVTRRYHRSDAAALAMARDLGYTIVTTSEDAHKGIPEPCCYCCPDCWQPVNQPLSCHALDVAMLQMVQGLPREQPGIAFFQQAYYTRLQEWRDEVLRRQQEQTNGEGDDDNDDVLQSAYVAQLIQEEEEILWSQRSAVVRAWKHTFPELTTVSFLVAMASIGVRMLLFQNARSSLRS